MVLRVHHGNRTEDLLDLMAGLVARHGREARSALEPVDLVVPNSNMATYVKLGLAQRNGIAANIRSRFMLGYVREAVERRRPEQDDRHRGEPVHERLVESARSCW